MACCERNELRVNSDTIDARHPEVRHLETDVVSSWYNAVIPIAVTLGMVVYFLYTTGVAALTQDPPPGTPTSGFLLRDIAGKANSTLALQYGAIGGLITATILARIQKLLTGPELIEAISAGARVVAPAIFILWCASTISSMTGNKSVDGDATTTAYQYKDHRLYTGDYLKTLLTTEVETDRAVAGDQTSRTASRFPLFLLPTVVFILSSTVAFCTGTSWGTMGILMPMVVALAHALLDVEGAQNVFVDPILLCTVGSVLSGAIFGDHCSPISDTTVLSSQCCSCDHIAHVWTQMPYALVVAGVNIVLGTLPMGFGVPVVVLLPLQIAAVFLILLIFGQKVESHSVSQ